MTADELIKLSDTNSMVKYIRKITIPTLYEEINSAIIILSEMLNDKSNSMSDFVITVLILESCIFIIGFFGLLLIIIWIC